MIFRETHHIFNSDNFGIREYFENKWMNYNKAVYPDTQEWDYGREMQIEDVDLWEVIQEWSNDDTFGGCSGIYAAWKPHAEFYMVKLPPNQGGVATFYGMGAEKKCRKYLDEKGIKYHTYPAGYDAGIKIDREGLHYKYKF